MKPGSNVQTACVIHIFAPVPVLSVDWCFTTMTTAVALAAPVPQRLLNFFARYPPNIYSVKYTGASYPLTQTAARLPDSRPPSSMPDDSSSVTVASTMSSSDPNEASVESTATFPPSQPSIAPPNPFLPWKNPETGRWRGAAIGLRRQADLVKIAKQHGVETLLPPGRKSTEFKEQRILEKGLRVKGTGEGQKVKGHKWERTMNATLEKRRKAMEEMPEMIRLWKQVSYLPWFYLPPHFSFCELSY
jgi:large subunit ribosomal protein L25